MDTDAHEPDALEPDALELVDLGRVSETTKQTFYYPKYPDNAYQLGWDPN